MKKFVLVTRGRTGSTAALDELDKSSALCTTRELFSTHDFAEKPKDYFKLLPLFDLWKQRGGWWTRMFPNHYCDQRQAHRYLQLLEELACNHGVKGLGWKVLSHHFEERPFLIDLLKQHGYRVVYLKRNSVRQVLSGMVANHRGIYNSVEKVVDARRYLIDIEEFKWHVEWERESVKRDIAMLQAEGFDFVEVRYEDYCDNREVFFGKIFTLLDLTPELPPPSDFKKMIEDPRMVIENYAEVASVAAAMGDPL